jgi:hypothetical protein
MTKQTTRVVSAKFRQRAQLRIDFSDGVEKVVDDGEVWDRQIEADSKAGKFDQLSAEALAEFYRGETTEL